MLPFAILFAFISANERLATATVGELKSVVVEGIPTWRLADVDSQSANGAAASPKTSHGAPYCAAAFAAMNAATVGGKALMGCRFQFASVAENGTLGLTFGRSLKGIGFVGLSSEPTTPWIAGMNDRGICIAAECALTRNHAKPDDANVGRIVREVLATSGSLAEARAIVESGILTWPTAFLVGDGKSPNCIVIERYGEKSSSYGPGDQGERPAPFFPMPHVIRRTGLLADPQLATSSEKHETTLVGRSVGDYQQLSNRISKSQPLDAAAGLKILGSTEQPMLTAASQRVVFDPLAGCIWLNPAIGPNANAVAPIVGFDLRQALESETPRAVRWEQPPSANGKSADRFVVKVNCPNRPNEADLPQLYHLDSTSQFDVEIEPWQVVAGVQRSRVRYPSPVVTPHPENNTVHTEFFRPFGKGPFRTAIVLHIAGGDFELSRFMSQMLAQNGTACLFMKMPYYGERRPKSGKIRMLSNNIEQGVSAMRQAVLDIRWACDWIQSNPDCDQKKIAVVGVSLGAVTGSLACAIEPRISHAGLIMGGARYEHIIFNSVEREAKESKKLWLAAGKTIEEFGKAMAPIDPATYADRLSQRSVLMICADDDKTIPMASTLSLWEATGRQPIVWYPCGHYTMVKYLLPALNHTVRFLRDWPTPRKFRGDGS